MICFMFPGQPLSPGPQLPDDEDFHAVDRLARERTGLVLQDLSWEGEPATGSVALQVYGAAMSLYHARRLRREGTRPALVAEHSMGIYAALATSGALSEGDALELTFRLGRCMSRMAETADYALGCMVGLPLAPLLAISENNGVYLANHNTSRHFLLSGERMSMEGAVAEALQAGAFSARVFPCDAPLHSPLMEEAADGLRAVIADYQYGETSIPLMNHIDQDFLTGAEVGDFLLKELMQPVYWERSCRELLSSGVTRFLEVGMGDALKKYNRWIMNEAARAL